MTDVAAAIGIHQLAKCDSFWKRRSEIAVQYNAALSDLPLKLPYVRRPEDLHAWHLYVIQLELEKLTITRDRFIELMADKGIGTSVHFIPLHVQPYWRDRYNFQPESYPVSWNAYQRAVSLPIYPRMTDEDVARVAGSVREILLDHLIDRKADL
jgi:dTDP-4-amino-4,6-dideoxygalactose transaminase